ncbi:hypothetical protein E2C01_031058 [Portunus trituberculatus]|uniref:Uncharacterized protein n=1 Tax=Portunus trituberculatus TaxID=210409 RepID=A0A5B7ETH0_PORTR|nr:hypothetical protein [Portunus trituberculatus]
MSIVSASFELVTMPKRKRDIGRTYLSGNEKRKIKIAKENEAKSLCGAMEKFVVKKMLDLSVSQHKRTEEGLRPCKRNSEVILRVSLPRAVGVRRGLWLLESGEVWDTLLVDLVGGTHRPATSLLCCRGCRRGACSSGRILVGMSCQARSSTLSRRPRYEAGQDDQIRRIGLEQCRDWSPFEYQ